MMFDDNDILIDLSKGDKNAFNLLYMMYAPKMEVFIAKMTKDKEVAEDITHNIFLKVWENRKVISKVNSFQHYVFRMAKNAVFDLFDHELIKSRYKKTLELRKNQRAVNYNQEEEFETKDLSILIDITINKMPLKRKTVFLLSRKEGLSHKEIAEKLDISPRTVENHISVAMSEIRKVIS